MTAQERSENIEATAARLTTAVEPITYSVPEVAVMLGINRNTAYELVARGEIPSIRLGKRVLVLRAALDRLLERGMPSK